MSSLEPQQPTLLLAGRGERMAEALRAALAERGVVADATSAEELVQRAYVEAPDLIVLIGDAARDGGRAALGELAANAGTAAIPVVLVADSTRLGAKIDAFRHGVVAVVARTASVDELAASLSSLARELPERAGEVTGGLAETSVDELVELLSEELRSGILSIGSGTASAQVVLEADRPFSEVVGELVEKLRPLVGTAGSAPLSYEFYETPGARIGSLDLDLPRDGSTDVLRGRRVLLIEENAARSDILVQELRAAGAEVVVADGEGNGLVRARLLDPEVAIVDGATDRGWSLGALRALRRDPRLRWASLLVTDSEQLWRGREPDIERLAASIAPLVAHDVELAERAKGEPAFDVRLEAVGPTRLLRALVSTGLGLRVRLSHPRVVVEVDLAEGLVVGAAAGSEDGQGRIEGAAALATFCAITAGRVQIERKDAPATTNVMTPLTEALAAAEREQSLIAPSVPPPHDEVVPAPKAPKVPSAGDSARVVKRLEQLLTRLDNVVEKGMTRAPRLSPTPARPIRVMKEAERPLAPTPARPFRVPPEAVAPTKRHPRLAPTPHHPVKPPPEAHRDVPKLTPFGDDEPADTGLFAVDALEELRGRAHRSEPPAAKKAPAAAQAKPAQASVQAKPAQAKPAPKGPRVRTRQPTLVGTPATTPVAKPAAALDEKPTPDFTARSVVDAALKEAARPVAEQSATKLASDAKATTKVPARSRQPTLLGSAAPEDPELTMEAVRPLAATPAPIEPPLTLDLDIPVEEHVVDERALRETEIAAPAVSIPSAAVVQSEPLEYVPSEPPPPPPPAPRAAAMAAHEEEPKPRSRSVVLYVVIALLLLVPIGGAAIWFLLFRDAGTSPIARPTPTAAPEAPETREPEAPETAQPEVAEVAQPEVAQPEVAQPEGTEEQQPEAQPETPETPQPALAAGAPIEGSEEGFSLASLGVEPPAPGSPRGPNAVANLLRGANARRMREDWPEAAAMYRQVLALDPENPRATAGLAMVHLGDGDSARAVAWAQRLVRLRSQYGSNYVLLGDAYQAAGDLASARRAWTRASELDPSLGTARERLRTHPE